MDWALMPAKQMQFSYSITAPGAQRLGRTPDVG